MTMHPATRHGAQTPTRRMWFGAAGAAVAWIVAEFINVLLSGQGCSRALAAALVVTPLWLRIGLGIITIALLGASIAAGIISYRTWRGLARNADLVAAEGHSRQEFVALVGLFVSATLGLGIFWFVLPIYIIRMCVRAH